MNITPEHLNRTIENAKRRAVVAERARIADAIDELAYASTTEPTTREELLALAAEVRQGEPLSMAESDEARLSREIEESTPPFDPLHLERDSLANAPFKGFFADDEGDGLATHRDHDDIAEGAALVRMGLTSRA